MERSEATPPKKLCEHRCIKSDAHDGEHFYGYAMGPSVPVYTRAEVKELLDTIDELRAELEAYGV
jgi:hypothetical protein